MTPQASDSIQARRALNLLTAVNYLNYIDRFMLAALLSSIQKDLHLSDFQGGLLATAFMLAYILTSPVFGWLVQRYQRTSLLTIGVSLWSFASLITGLAGQFSLMFSSRFLLGVGESMFTTVSAPFLTDYYKPERRARAFSIFASGATAGAALGYVIGGLLGGYVGWRNSFFIAGIPGFILAFFIYKLPEPSGEIRATSFHVGDAYRELRKNRPFICAVIGYTAFTFVVGGLAHWMPTYIQRTFSYSPQDSNMLFGGIAVINGFLGTLLGGFWSGRLKLKYDFGYLYFCAICMFLVVPCFIACFFTTHLILFIAFMSLTQFLFFLPTSPINVLIMECVPSALRTMAMAISIFACHIFGDAISSPLIGWISDQTGALRTGLVWCAPMVFLSGAFWLLGVQDRSSIKNLIVS